MQFESLYQELKDSSAMIRALLAGIGPQDAMEKPHSQSWSVLEVVCHLYDEEREDFREHLNFILNRRDETWHTIDPDGWVTERRYNQQDFVNMREKFFAERARSLEWLDALRGRDWDVSFTTEFRVMSAGDMLSSWVAHDNLHIRQLVELRRSRIERITQPYAIAYAGDW
ncbi:MAG: DinB family protein [Bacteroidota bacterium]